MINLAKKDTMYIQRYSKKYLSDEDYICVF